MANATMNKVTEMKEFHEFLVPDYYPAFSCKMGACRHACCEGWPVSFTRQDYFNLLGVDCSPELRKKIDCAMHLVDCPTFDEYAQIAPRYDGNCPMRLEDGRCGMHAELGEDALAAVCRLYPRGVRSNAGYECSCANSCEVVPEMLLTHPEPIKFRKFPLSIDVPAEPEYHEPKELTMRRQSTRLWLISLIQNREYSLPQRFDLLHEGIIAIDRAFHQHNWEQIDTILSGQAALKNPEAFVKDASSIKNGLKQGKPIIEYIVEHSESIRPYGEAIFRYFDDGKDANRHYKQALERFEELMPDWQIWFENLLVNHMFFTKFPFEDPPIPMEDAFRGFCGVYVLLRFLCIGWAVQHDSVQQIIDVVAAAFRLIEHTDFTRYAATLLYQAGCNDKKHMCQLLCL